MNQEQRTRRRRVSVRHAAVVTACLGIIALLTIAYWLAAIRLPDPASADRNGLIRWMVWSDLSTESMETRTILLIRLQEEVVGNLEPRLLEDQLDDHSRMQLCCNIEVLIETWLSMQLDTYLATPSSERTQFLDQAISQVTQWRDVSVLSPVADSDNTSSGTAMLKLLGEVVLRWKESASPERRREIEDFDAALRGRWLLHALGLAAGHPN